jgi:TldD protein
MTTLTDPRSHIYQPGKLSPDEAQALARETLARCDDGELYLQFIASETFGFDDGRLKTADYSRESGFGLRGVTGEMTGFAHANDLSAGAIRRAGETLRLLDPAHAPRPAPPRQNNRHLYTDASPLDLVPFAAKVKLLEDIDAAARARDPRVSQVSASLSGSWSVVEIVRPDGFLATDIRPLVRLNVSIVAESNGRRETGSFGMGGRWLYDRLFEADSWNRAIDEALAQALVNLESVDAPAGEMTVLLGPGWPGVLLHEAIGHGLEGDFNRKGTSAFSGRIGERVAAPGVTVVDDGSLLNDRGEGRRGSLSIDDEGTPTGETVLIEDGILKGYMQDRLNARLMGVEPTGNGRREDYAHAPHAAHDQHIHARRQGRSGRAAGPHEERHIRAQLRRRAGGHRVRQVRVLVHRSLQGRERQAGRADQGGDPDRRRAKRAHPRHRHRQRHGARRRRGRVRQGRAIRACRSRPADDIGQCADRRWNRRMIDDEEESEAPLPPSDWAERVLQFWLVDSGFADWFAGGAEFDTKVADRFAGWREALSSQPVEVFLTDAKTALAANILFDQVPRNVHRGDSRSLCHRPSGAGNQPRGD